MSLEIKENREIWSNLVRFLEQTTGKKPKDLNGVLFLIGVQELGKGGLRFDKEQKQDLMHIGICKVLSLGGFYALEGLDEEGWPHWKQVKEMPHIDFLSQENLLKHYVIRYFQEEIGVHL